MANEEHLAILNEGVEAWNRWRDVDWEKTQINPDLTGVNLTGEHLGGVDFSGANLSNACFNGAHLYGADFASANLNAANLSKADLSFAKLCSANLRGAVLDHAKLHFATLHYTDLTGANLRFAELIGANLIDTLLNNADLQDSVFSRAIISYAALDGADFRNAVMEWTTFGVIDLSKARGLEQVKHSGPSSISIETIYRSHGAIPEIFLRGAGVPENLIAYLPSFIQPWINSRFHSCFISHSSEDKEFADRLHRRMQQAHLGVWYAPKDMKSGAKLHEQIEMAIHRYDKLLIVLSEASLQSEWVMTEIRRALKSKRERGKPDLFPLRLVSMEAIHECKAFDSDSGKYLADELSEYFIPDFSNWKDPDQFEATFARLLKDLRAEERAK